VLFEDSHNELTRHGLMVRIYDLHERVVDSNTREVTGGDRKGSQLQFSPELQQSLPVNQEANSMTPYREYREYKLHDPVQGISGV